MTSYRMFLRFAAAAAWQDLNPLLQLRAAQRR
jgi:hypothetical protein